MATLLVTKRSNNGKLYAAKDSEVRTIAYIYDDNSVKDNIGDIWTVAKCSTAQADLVTVS
jgi:hypothetical protein